MLELRRDPDLALEARRTQDLGYLIVQDLQGYGTIMPEFMCEQDRGHPAPPELALDAVSVRQPVTQFVEFCHGWTTGRLNNIARAGS